jgi:hypothetical protein
MQEWIQQAINSQAIVLFVYLLFAHWVADFVLQTHKMAINKSKDNIWLTKHVLTYTGVMGALTAPFFIGNDSGYWLFIMYLFILHWVTDWLTSHMVAKRWEKQDYHNGFVIIGFDQILHYLQIFALLLLFAKKG